MLWLIPILLNRFSFHNEFNWIQNPLNEQRRDSCLYPPILLAHESWFATRPEYTHKNVYPKSLILPKSKQRPRGGNAMDFYHNSQQFKCTHILLIFNFFFCASVYNIWYVCMEALWLHCTHTYDIQYDVYISDPLLNIMKSYVIFWFQCVYYLYKTFTIKHCCDEHISARRDRRVISEYVCGRDY